MSFYPSKEDIARRHADGIGLTRPELSVLLAYSKLVLYDEMLETKLPDDGYYEHDLILYFPEQLRKKYKTEIMSHPLKREIVATSITNSIINRIGVEMYYMLKESTGMDGCDIARAYTIVRDIFGLRELWQDIEDLSDKTSVMIQVELFMEIRRLIERVVFWLLKHHSSLQNVDKGCESLWPRYEEALRMYAKCPIATR